MGLIRQSTRGQRVVYIGKKEIGCLLTEGKTTQMEKKRVLQGEGYKEDGCETWDRTRGRGVGVFCTR